MKIYSFFLFASLVFLSCHNQKYSNLRIKRELDNKYFGNIHVLTSANIFSLRTKSSYWEDIHDSIPNGETTVSVFSLLTPNIYQKIDLKKDTSVSITDHLYSQFYKGNKESLIKLNSIADTIYIGQIVAGCSSRSSEKMALFKKENKLHVEFEKDFGLFTHKLTVMRDTLYELYLKKFLIESAKLFKEPDENYNFSTTVKATFIRIGNVIYELPDVNNWDVFNNLKTNLGINPGHLIDPELRYLRKIAAMN